MKYILPFIILFSLSMSTMAQEYEYIYNLFNNSLMPDNYFYSQTTASGGSTIKNLGSRLPVNKSIFHTPGNSLEIMYKNAAGGKWQTIIFHKDKRGMDHFRKASFLSIWLHDASKGIPAEELPVIFLMKKDSSLSSPISIPALKAGEWQQVIIPMANTAGFDALHPENIIGIVMSQAGDKDGPERILYVDDIEFLPFKSASPITVKPSISSAKSYEKHVDLQWEKIAEKSVHLIKIYRSDNKKDYFPIGIQQPYMNRYTDFTGETGKKYSYKISFLDAKYQETDQSSAEKAETKPMTDEELLTMVQEAGFRYYWEGAENRSGLAKENIPGRQNMIAIGASGFGIMSLIVGTERKFISKEESIERFLKILTFLERAETFHGAYPHFMNGLTKKVEPFFGNRDNGADLVETSFLMEGLLAARQYFSGTDPKEVQIRKKITGIWNKIEWDWFRQTPDSKFLYWHWSPDQGWVINHTLVGWNETMVTYLLAIASPTHPVPATMYYSGWANQDSTGIKYRSAWGGTMEGSMYTNGNTYYGFRLDVGVSNGGPLFFTHYSFMGYDPHFITDKYTNYFKNNQNIANINLSYCLKNPHNYKGYGEGGWGLTASDGPFDYSADEPVSSRDCGKLTPTGAISSFPYTPAASMKALKSYYNNYGKFLWGEYGFRDSFELDKNWCSEIFMGLNQAPMVVMIENYRSGLIWKLFMQDPEIQEGLKKLEQASK
jgi:exo beta-1,2-glucooligosaccharide sophorohydrolase (non-reducing end)